jgi:hypothetical protein
MSLPEPPDDVTHPHDHADHDHEHPHSGRHSAEDLGWAE